MGGAEAPYFLGIDLGTTYTAAAVCRDGRAEVATLGLRAQMVPSVLLLREDGQFLYGEAAEHRATSEPHRVTREFKRRIGDPTPIIVDKTPFAADALMAKLLRWVVDTVSDAEGAPPAGIAISHPANWGEYKRDLFRQAIRVHGLEAAVMLTEPEAAAIHYASQKRVDTGSVVAVYDLGGGTFDAAVLKRTEHGWEILGRPEGIERLGGVDFDQAVFGHVVTATGIAADLDDDDPALRTAVHRLRRDCVASKEALSSDTATSISVLLPKLQSHVRLTRTEFEDMIRPTLRDTLIALSHTLRSADLTAEDVQAVLLVGGSSRIPVVAQLVTAELGRPVATDAHPKHSVALGAAIIAAEDGSRHEAPHESPGPPVGSQPALGLPLAPGMAPTAGVPPVPAAATASYPPQPPPVGIPASASGGQRPNRTALLVAIAGLLAVAAVAAFALRPSVDDDPETAADNPTTETTAGPSTTVAPTTSTTSPQETTTTTPAGGESPSEPALSEVPIPTSDMDPNESSYVLVDYGTGDPAAAGDRVTFQFVGRLADGSVFVNSWETSGAVTFTLGSDELLSGFDQALRGLVPGDRAEISVGSEAAYGAEGNRDGTVPPNSNLAYLVDVISVNGVGED